jgi:hypothetical protein
MNFSNLIYSSHIKIFNRLLFGSSKSKSYLHDRLAVCILGTANFFIVAFFLNVLSNILSNKDIGIWFYILSAIIGVFFVYFIEKKSKTYFSSNYLMIKKEEFTKPNIIVFFVYFLSSILSLFLLLHN